MIIRYDKIYRHIHVRSEYLLVDSQNGIYWRAYNLDEQIKSIMAYESNKLTGSTLNLFMEVELKNV